MRTLVRLGGGALLWADHARTQRAGPCSDDAPVAAGMWS